MPLQARVWRTASRPPPKTPCGYCFQKWATGWDHLIPVSFRVDNGRENLYPSCGRCNSILSNRLFDSIQAKRDYVRARLIELNRWKFPVGEELLPLTEVVIAAGNFTTVGLPKDAPVKTARRFATSGQKRCALISCRQFFTPTRRWQKFCCVEHRNDSHFKTPTFNRMRPYLEKALERAEREFWHKLTTNPPRRVIERLVEAIAERILKSREKVGR